MTPLFRIQKGGRNEQEVVVQDQSEHVAKDTPPAFLEMPSSSAADPANLPYRTAGPIFGAPTEKTRKEVVARQKSEKMD